MVQGLLGAKNDYNYLQIAVRILHDSLLIKSLTSDLLTAQKLVKKYWRQQPQHTFIFIFIYLDFSFLPHPPLRGPGLIQYCLPQGRRPLSTSLQVFEVVKAIICPVDPLTLLTKTQE